MPSQEAGRIIHHLQWQHPSRVFPLEMVDNSNNLCKPPLWLVISSVGSSIRLFHPEVRPIRHPLLALSPLSPHHAPAPASTLSGSQAETFGKGQESTSFAVHRRFVFPAAIAGVRCRYRCARWLPPRSCGCTSLTRSEAWGRTK